MPVCVPAPRKPPGRRAPLAVPAVLPGRCRFVRARDRLPSGVGARPSRRTRWCRRAGSRARRRRPPRPGRRSGSGARRRRGARRDQRAAGSSPSTTASAADSREPGRLSTSSSARARPAELLVAGAAVTDHRVERVRGSVAEQAGDAGEAAPDQRGAPRRRRCSRRPTRRPRGRPRPRRAPRYAGRPGGSGAAGPRPGRRRAAPRRRAASRPSDRPPRTAQVAAAVSRVRATGRSAVSRSTTTPAPTALPTRTTQYAAPRARLSAYSRLSRAAAAWPNPATGWNRRGSPKTWSASEAERQPGGPGAHSRSTRPATTRCTSSQTRGDPLVEARRAGRRRAGRPGRRRSRRDRPRRRRRPGRRARRARRAARPPGGVRGCQPSHVQPSRSSSCAVTQVPRLSSRTASGGRHLARSVVQCPGRRRLVRAAPGPPRRRRRHPAPDRSPRR